MLSLASYLTLGSKWGDKPYSSIFNTWAPLSLLETHTLPVISARIAGEGGRMFSIPP